MIDINLYPKHDWVVDEYSGFAILYCKKCGTRVTERYVGSIYLNVRYNSSMDLIHMYKDINLNIDYDDNMLNEIRSTILNCDDVIIKRIIE